MKKGESQKLGLYVKLGLLTGELCFEGSQLLY